MRLWTASVEMTDYLWCGGEQQQLQTAGPSTAALTMVL